MPNWTPIRWPDEWRDPARLELIAATPFNFLLIGEGEEFAPIRAAAKSLGLQTGPLPDDVRIVKGEWPGIRISQNGDDSAAAGPTGEPWVDSNGWRVAIEKASSPAHSICWVDAPPKSNAVIGAGAMRLVIADAAAAGGRWIVSLNDALAKGIGDGNSHSVETWKEAIGSAAFFARQAEWMNWASRATIGVVSDFAGKNGALTREVLNLIGRGASHYRAIVKGAALNFDQLRAVLYADFEAPVPALRATILEFVKRGGTLITTPDWGAAEGTPRTVVMRPGFRSFTYGKGRIEMAAERVHDPYTLANDAVIIVSHRYDLARMWNAGAHASYVSVSPDGKRTLAQFLTYSDQAVMEATAWVAGKYRSAKLYTIEASPRPVDMIPRAGGVEIHLPHLSQYVAIELERI